jgi:Flp pilus assembly protein TadD
MPNGSVLAEPLSEALIGRDNTAALAIATEHLRQGRLDAAHAVLRGVLEHSPGDLGAVNGLAAEAAARGDAARAQAVGASKRLSAVRWGVAGNIVTAWVLTIPAAGAIAAISMFVLGKLFH